jgi:hypothetical protein
MKTKSFLIVAGLIVLIGLGISAAKNKPVAVTPVVPVSIVPITMPAPPTPAAASASFGKAVALATGKSISYGDGLNVMLKEISDSRCKPNVQCIWAGELSAKLEVNGGAISTNKEIILGTARNRTESTSGYTFTLNSATIDSATITVTKNGNEPITCSQIAKLCPDGSYVSRTGPNCEFAECK